MSIENNFWFQMESRRLEFKEHFSRGKQVAKTAVTFANGAGGQIVFGVRNDPREVKGIPDSELFHLEERIVQHIFDNCTPSIIPEIYIQHADGKNVLVAEIFPGSQKSNGFSVPGNKYLIIIINQVKQVVSRFSYSCKFHFYTSQTGLSLYYNKFFTICVHK